MDRETLSGGATDGGEAQAATPETLTIGGGQLRASVSTTGAQLMSLSLGGVEYLWQGDPAWWPRRSPVLFPIVGSLRTGTVSAEGPCPMGRHGVARGQAFRVVEHGGAHVALECEATENTLAVYPYRFRLRMSYTVTGEATLEQRFEVTNAGEVPLPYVVGGHPAFALPLGGAASVDGTQDVRASRQRDAKAEVTCGASAGAPGDTPESSGRATMGHAEACGNNREHENPAFEGCSLSFARAWSACSPTMVTGELLDFGQPIPVIEKADSLPFRRGLFATDTLVLRDVPEHTVALLDKRTGRSVRLDFPGFDYLGVWSAEHGAAPFVAVEPWTGCATATDEGARLEEKRGMRLLAPGASATHAFTMTLA